MVRGHRNRMVIGQSWDEAGGEESMAVRTPKIAEQINAICGMF